METISLVVPAAGSGVRTGLKHNKIFLPLQGRALIWWTVRALTGPEVWSGEWQPIELVLACRAEDEERLRQELCPSASSPTDYPDDGAAAVPVDFPVRIARGGVTRQHSVANALKLATGTWVLVHDAARPFPSPALIQATCDAAFRHGAALAARPAADTVKLAQAEKHPAVVRQTLNRELVWLAQTPQVFARELLDASLRHAAVQGLNGTDCASLVEYYLAAEARKDYSIALVPGEADNLKVTFPADLERAVRLLSSRCRDDLIN